MSHLTVKIILSESLEEQTELIHLKRLLDLPRGHLDDVLVPLLLGPGVLLLLLLLLLGSPLGLLLLVHAVVVEHLGEVEGGPDGWEAVEHLFRLGVDND